MKPQTIRVVDFETTGTEPPADVIEAGYCDVTRTETGWRVSAPVSAVYFSNQITAETRAIHHISPADVADAPPFRPAAFVGQAVLEGVSAFAAHRADFELKWLSLGALTIPVICTYKAALRVWPDAPSHSNQCLRYWIEEQGLSDINHFFAMPPHRGGPDAYATAHTLKALLRTVSPEAMVLWTGQPALLPRLTIGKERGKKWCDVDDGFLRWMLRQQDMDPDLVWNARYELQRRGAP